MHLRCAGRSLDLSRPIVMGVLNVTPDSFSDGGRFVRPEDAIAQGVRMAAEGAEILDVGGESTRPGSQPVDPDEELRRVIPVIQGLRSATAAVVSVDTSKPRVMRAAAEAGAGMINDVRALREDGALTAALESDCAVCLMHMQGTPATMQRAPAYQDVAGEVRSFLQARYAACRAAGFEPERLCIDPGFGFGKTVEHNLELLRRLGELRAIAPVLVGLSRKALVGALTGRSAGERIHGSVALAITAVLNGASIVRVHDVAATADAINTLMAVWGERASPARPSAP